MPGPRGRVSRKTLTLGATALGSSLAFLDATVVVVALPRIDRDLGLGLTGQQWVYLSYSLALASFYLVGGAAGDRLGRRRTFVAGVLGFALASALAGAAPNEAVLLVARVLQGIAGAFLTTNSLALLRTVYGAGSGRAIGLWTSLTGVATIAGPLIGGALAEWASWRWIFFVNLPLATAAVVLAWLGRGPEPTQRRDGPVDLAGAACAAAGFGFLTYAIVEGADGGFAHVAWGFAIAGLALAAFVLVERRAPQPLLPFSLFRRRNFSAATVETFLVYGALGGVGLYFTLYLQFLGFSPFEAGLATVPMIVVIILLAPRFGALADAIGPRLLLTLGPALVGTGALVFLFLDDRSDFWWAGITGIVLFSVGLAALVAPITSTALGAAPPELVGVASGVNATVSRLGRLLAVAVIGLVVTLVFERSGGGAGATPLAAGQVDEQLRSASIDAFRAGMLLASALAFAGSAVGWRWISNPEVRAAQKAVPETAPL